MTSFATQSNIQMTAPGLVGRALAGAGKSKLLTASELRGLLGTGSGGLGAKYLADDSTWKTIDLSGYATTAAVASGYQPLDADLTSIAGLTATTDNFLQSKAGVWASRTVAQVKTDLGLTGTNTGDQNLSSYLTSSVAASTYLPLAGGTLSGLLQFSGTTHAGLRLNNITTTQRDAIATPQAGMSAWNTTTSRINVHDGASWTNGFVRLSGDTMTGALSLGTNALTCGSITCTQPTTSTVGLTVKGTASRTAPLLQLQTSAGALVGNVGGVTFNSFTDTSSTSVDGTENDLYSYTTVADTLAINGATIEQKEHVQFVSSATASRRLRKYFAGTLIFDSAALTLSLGGDFWLETNIIRESATVVRASVNVVTTSASTVPYATYTRITALTLTGTNILKTTGTAAGAGAASGDIVNKFSKVVAMPAA